MLVSVEIEEFRRVIMGEEMLDLNLLGIFHTKLWNNCLETSLYPLWMIHSIVYTVNVEIFALYIFSRYSGF